MCISRILWYNRRTLLDFDSDFVDFLLIFPNDIGQSEVESVFSPPYTSTGVFPSYCLSLFASC